LGDVLVGSSAFPSHQPLIETGNQPASTHQSRLIDSNLIGDLINLRIIAVAKKIGYMIP
jgi:hypothetical protein